VLLPLTALALTAVLAAGQSNDFISTWKAPGAAPTSFAGRKVATVFIVDDLGLQMSVEEALAREVSARGPVGVAGYRVIPREEVKKKDAAKAWFEKSGAAGLVVLRIVKTDTEKVYSSMIWSSGYYGSAWDYWDYGWASVYPLGEARLQRTLTVETLVYDVSKGTPIWAGVSRTTDPKDVQSYIKRLVVDVVKRLQQDGLITKAR
jgi:hypothetical protein